MLSPNEWYLKIFCWVTKASPLFQQYSFPSLLNYICLIMMWIYGSFPNPIPRSSRFYILFHRIFYDQKFLILWSMELRYWLCAVYFKNMTKIGPNTKVQHRPVCYVVPVQYTFQKTTSKRFTVKNSSSLGETADA